MTGGALDVHRTPMPKFRLINVHTPNPRPKMNHDADCPNDPLNGKIVTEVFRFSDARENGIVFGVAAGGERLRFVFPMNVASQLAAGLIDGPAESGDPLAKDLKSVIDEYRR